MTSLDCIEFSDGSGLELSSLKPGFNVALIHPVYNDTEMQAVTIDHSKIWSKLEAKR